MSSTFFSTAKVATANVKVFLEGTFDTAASDGAVTNITGDIASVVRSTDGVFVVTFNSNGFTRLVVNNPGVEVATAADDAGANFDAVDASAGSVTVRTLVTSTAAPDDLDATIHVTAVGVE